jgi:general nucleoside transport system permease protein
MNTLSARFLALRPLQRALVASALGLFALAITRVVSGADDLTSGNTLIATMATAAPIIAVALGGLYSERAGVANIGLEGMMVLGTWFAAFAGWHWGPWAALAGGAFGGMLGGLLHALATVTFGVDQIVSGVAINFIAPGVARFLSSEIFIGKGANGEGTISSSPSIAHSMGRFRVPGIANWLRTIDNKRWFFVSDLAGAIRAFVDQMAWSTLIILLFIPATIYVLWRTPFGLRLRSVGEKPSAAESLGVAVYRLKYIALAISGSLAGLGGAWLVVNVRQYNEGQTAGRGFLGLAALIFGNWQPIGVALGALLFSYGISLQQAVGTKPIKALYLFIAAAFLALCLFMVFGRRSKRVALGLAISAAGLFLYYLNTKTVASQIVYVTPYIIVLVVITFASKRSRPPAAVGIPWRRGQST